MKKFFLLVVAFLCLFLTACGIGDRSNAVSEKTILQDIQRKLVDYTFDDTLEITDFNIIKRQTNADEKNDIVWVNIFANNDSYKIEQNFKLTYVLYNDGWMLENTEVYSDNTYNNHVYPLKGADKSIVEKYGSEEYLIEKIALSSDDYLTYDFNLLSHDQPNLYDQGGIDTYYYVFTIKHHKFDEIVTVPVEFNFKMSNKSGKWEWEPFVYTDKIKRERKLNSGILGEDKNHSHYISVTDFGDTWCMLTLTLIHNGISKTFSGKVILREPVVYGNVSSVGLTFENRVNLSFSLESNKSDINIIYSPNIFYD